MAVEKEVDKVLSKFGNINEHADRVISDLISFIEDINTELRQGECTSRTIHHKQKTRAFHLRSLRVLRSSSRRLRTVQIPEGGAQTGDDEN